MQMLRYDAGGGWESTLSVGVHGLTYTSLYHDLLALKMQQSGVNRFSYIDFLIPGALAISMVYSRSQTSLCCIDAYVVL